MHWQVILIIAAVVVGGLLIRRQAFLSPEAACQYLKEGALIVDVRSPQEFGHGHVPGALNMPLSGLPDNLVGRITNKQQVLLLHCLSGGRSAIAQRRLRAEGYTRVFNVGSYHRAEAIVAEAKSQ